MVENGKMSQCDWSAAFPHSIPGFKVFGVQFYGECWSGENAELTYDKYGSSDDCDLINKVGKNWSNFVYRLVGKNTIIAARATNSETKLAGMDSLWNL